MRLLPPVLLALILAGLVLPVLAAEENRIGYVSFEEMSLQLENGKARVEVNYTLDPGMGLIILLFGAGDLEKKIEQSLNFPSGKAEEVGLSSAVFTVDDAAQDDGGGAYWFPAHGFGVTFPVVRVEAPGLTRSFTDVSAIPKGFGYFGSRP